ncbi:MAG: hypothetical protein KJ811_04615, partial [Candidatus Margulisbacteria bacterium]|nr:hypothetical protein [Candidatus Margulisiibacteriota bacterium]
MLRAQISNLRKLGQNLVDRLPQNVRQTVSNQLRRLVNKEARDNLVAQLKTHAQNGSSVIGSYLSVLTRLNIVEIDFLRLFTTLHSLNLVSGLELNEVVGKVEDLRQQRSQAQKEVTPESADLHSQQLAKEVVEVVSEADILETISVEEDVPRELELSSREKAEIGKLAQRAIDESATRIRGEKAAAHSRMLDVFETEAVGRVRASMGELNNLSGLARDLQVVLANRGEEVEISALMREASSSPDTFALRILRNVEGVIARLTSEPNLVPLKMVSDLRELLLERTVLVTVYSSSDKELLESFIWEQYGVEHITPRYLLNY